MQVLVCDYCGKSFERVRNKARQYKHNFCSTVCFDKWRSGPEKPLRNQIEKSCTHCGKIFKLPKYRLEKANNFYCSTACKKADQIGKPSHKKGPQASLTCAQCGIKFERPEYLVKNPGASFCGKNCHDEWQRSHPLTGPNHPTYNSITVICSCCGKPIIQPVSQAKLGKNHFCNQECKADWQREHLKGRGNPSYKGSLQIVRCFTCGKEIKRIKSKLERNKESFCSTACYAEWRSEYTSGENNPTWKGGTIDYYGPDWKRQRRKARRRDGYKCQCCGITEVDLGRELDVHHKIPFRSFGYILGQNDNYKQANHLSNLISLCSQCHKLVEHGSLLLPQTATLV